MRLAGSRWHNQLQRQRLPQTRINLMEVYESPLHSLMTDSRFQPGQMFDAYKRMTQTQMAGRLSMDPRSYVELDQGKSSCSALTLALFLIYVCKDSDTFLEKLRIALEGDDHAA